MRDTSNKTAYIIAGPNGSGKTTFSVSMIKNTRIMTGAHLNPDIIARASGIDSSANEHEHISRMVEQKIDELINEGENFILESVFSSAYKLELFYKLKRNGYTVNIVYVATEDPLLNVMYVAKRFMKNGHEVPISKIIKRYKGAMDNIKTIANDVDCLILIDNSIPNETAKIYTALTNGKQCYVDNDNMPQWIKNILDNNTDKTDDKNKELVCSEIQSVLNKDFSYLINLDTDKMLSLLGD